jgi:UDP-N-acetylglucosamine--N-acetylmuramyl-(pentapeptide) pyrophosphoryl-undecaprenol N-acetylglucosamine transferase
MPGAATAEAIVAQAPGARCLFVTTPRKAERQCLPALAAFEVAEVPSTPWRGMAQKVRLPDRLLRAAVRLLGLMMSFRPHVVVGLGGANSILPLLLARLLGVPTMVLESNAMPGQAVRLLAPLTDCVVLQWAQAEVGLSARRTLVAGNPVRARLFASDKQAARRRLGLSPDVLTALVLGGSQGARPLNEALFGALEMLRARGVGLQVVHLTGVDHLPGALERLESGRLGRYRPIGFLNSMEDAYAAADFVVARAGGSTLAELTALGLPAILVPYPFAAGGHQQANVAVLADAGAALVIKQAELTARGLAATLATLAEDSSLRLQMAAAACRLGRPRAAFDVAAEAMALAGFEQVQGRPTPAQERQLDRFSQAA